MSLEVSAWGSFFAARPNLHCDDEREHTLLDATLGPGFAVALAGSVLIPSRTLGGESRTSLIGRRRSLAASFFCDSGPERSL
jgi:hypothetical protein